MFHELFTVHYMKILLHVEILKVIFYRCSFKQVCLSYQNNFIFEFFHFLPMLPFDLPRKQKTCIFQMFSLGIRGEHEEEID